MHRFAALLPIVLVVKVGMHFLNNLNRSHKKLQQKRCSNMLESAVTSLMLSCVYRIQSHKRGVKTKVWWQACPNIVFWVRIALPLFVMFVGFAPPHNVFEIDKGCD